MQKSEEEQEIASGFLANTLHEIRTPIQTIIGTLELLSDTQLNNEQIEYVHQLQFSSDVLLALANDVLDFSKIRSQEFKLEYIPFDITFVTERTVDLITIESFNKGLEIITDIDPDVPPLVMGDPTRIQQILLNLIKNAVKFTTKGYVRVMLSCHEGNLLFKVADSGIGITSESKEKLFTTFYQADRSTTRKYGGTGLGLSICKGLVNAMHGKIGVQSNRPNGSIFWFSIPLIISDNEQPKEQKLQIPSDTRILLVDNSPLALKSFERKLQILGITDIHTASTGSQAIRMLMKAAKEGHPFTEAFIDMIMPVMDGWRLAADINAKTEINSIKLYLVVPEGQMGGEAKMKLLNWYNGYLYKPIKRLKLRDILQKAFTEPIDLESVDDVEELEPVDRPAGKNFTEDAARTAEGLHILVAEDHPVNRKLLVTFLTKFGTIPLEAADGQEAVDVVQKHPEIDLIFMDIQMPVKNGIEAALEVRKDGFNGIIIACTANNDSNDLEEYHKNGINDTLIKPFKSKSVKAVIEKWKSALILTSGSESSTSKSLIEIKAVTGLGLWNQQDFEDTIGGDAKLGCQLLADYISQTEKLLNDTGLSIADRDFLFLRRMGHTLQGSSAAISAQLLAQDAMLMDTAAKASNIIDVQTNYENFSKHFKQFKLTVEEWQAAHEKTSKN